MEDHIERAIQQVRDVATNGVMDPEWRAQLSIVLDALDEARTAVVHLGCKVVCMEYDFTADLQCANAMLEESHVTLDSPSTCKEPLQVPLAFTISDVSRAEIIPWEGGLAVKLTFKDGKEFVREIDAVEKQVEEPDWGDLPGEFAGMSKMSHAWPGHDADDAAAQEDGD
jgi:hypothetical protein